MDTRGGADKISRRAMMAAGVAALGAAQLSGQNGAPPKLGVIGAGKRARRHLRVLSEIEGVEVAALCDVEADRMRAAWHALSCAIRRHAQSLLPASACTLIFKLAFVVSSKPLAALPLALTILHPTHGLATSVAAVTCRDPRRRSRGIVAAGTIARNFWNALRA